MPGINLQSVAEACSLLSACGGESEGEVVLTYPGRDGRLVLEIEGTSRQDSERVAHSAAFATIASEEPSDLERVELATAEEGAEPPEHEVIAAAEVSTGVLKEVVDDVEWAGGSVHVELQPNAGIKLSSDGGTGHVGIEVECACTQGSSPSNQDAVVDVKHNHLKNACPLPSAFTSIDKGCVTRVTLLQKEQSNLALLRISHHVRLTPHRTACTVCFFVHPLETAVLAT
jgi:hypothetical protein